MYLHEIPNGKVQSATQKIGKAIGDHADRVVAWIDNSHNADQFAHTILPYLCYEPNSAHCQAFKTMAPFNCLDIRSAADRLGISPTAQQLALLENIPFSSETLTACANDYVLVAEFPISIVEICDRLERKLVLCVGGIERVKDLFPLTNWLRDQEFAHEYGKTGWRLLRKKPIPGLSNLSWSGQREQLVDSGEEVASARLVAYATFLHFLVAVEPPLFHGARVRCSDTVGGHQVLAGFLGNIFRICAGDDSQTGFGVATIKKPQKLVSNPT